MDIRERLQRLFPTYQIKSTNLSNIYAVYKDYVKCGEIKSYSQYMEDLDFSSTDGSTHLFKLYKIYLTQTITIDKIIEKIRRLGAEFELDKLKVSGSEYKDGSKRKNILNVKVKGNTVFTISYDTIYGLKIVEVHSSAADINIFFYKELLNLSKEIQDLFIIKRGGVF